MGAHLFKKNPINVGDTKQRVVEIMGQPENRQTKGSREAWQYCDTSFGHYNFFVVWLDNGTVSGTNTYGRGPSAFSGCDNHYDKINWETAPDQTIEIRNR